MMFYVAGMGGVLCYSISPKRQGWLVKVQIGTMRVVNIASRWYVTVEKECENQAQDGQQRADPGA
ncbi:hypothetical protein SLEP1_g12226 [Rubroshorea leprosula]|uniref:Uncharacterized protein n=1 Tax=Rubroshorea leprosula TaxID=152421 RepID=A0AAV5IHN8_9ROSI|nr:hypothetical protein SLEP1_g12226 [Rubroshorea leprosula]